MQFPKVVYKAMNLFQSRCRQIYNFVCKGVTNRRNVFIVEAAGGMAYIVIALNR